MTNNSLLRAKGCPLHELVFKNDISGVSKLINQHKLDEEVGLEKLQDHHGNTPLHLAVMLGHKECVQILLKHGHAVNIKNDSIFLIVFCYTYNKTGDLHVRLKYNRIIEPNQLLI